MIGRTVLVQLNVMMYFAQNAVQLNCAVQYVLECSVLNCSQVTPFPHTPPTSSLALPGPDATHKLGSQLLGHTILRKLL